MPPRTQCWCPPTSRRLGRPAGDTMDDPAVWVNHASPADSLVIANDKLGALETYDLGGPWCSGSLPDNLGQRRRPAGPRHRQLHRRPRRRLAQGVRFYNVNPTTRMLSPVNDAQPERASVRGCACTRARPRTRSTASDHHPGAPDPVRDPDADNDGLLETTPCAPSRSAPRPRDVSPTTTPARSTSARRTWRCGATAPSRPAADARGGRRPHRAGGHLANDIEGVTLVDQANGGGYVIVSAQNVANPNARTSASTSEARQRLREHLPGGQRDQLRRLRPDRRDHRHDREPRPGVPAWHVRLPGQQQRPSRHVRQPEPEDGPPRERRGPRRGGPPPPPPPPPPSTRSRSSGRSTAQHQQHVVHGARSRRTQAGDALLLFASHGSTVTLTGPGAGWTQVGRVVDSSVATTVWRRTAVPAMPARPCG